MITFPMFSHQIGLGPTSFHIVLKYVKCGIFPQRHYKVRQPTQSYVYSRKIGGEGITLVELIFIFIIYVY